MHSCLPLLASAASLIYSPRASRSLGVHSSPLQTRPHLADDPSRSGKQPECLLGCFCVGSSSMLAFRPRGLLGNASQLLSYWRKEFSVGRNGMFGPPRGERGVTLRPRTAAPDGDVRVRRRPDDARIFNRHPCPAAVATWRRSDIPQHRRSVLKQSHLRSRGPVLSPEQGGQMLTSEDERRCVKGSTSGCFFSPPLSSSRQMVKLPHAYWWAAACGSVLGGGARISGRRLENKAGERPVEQIPTVFTVGRHQRVTPCDRSRS